MQIKIGKDNDLYITNVIVKASFASFVSTTALQPLDYMKTQKQQPPRNVSPILSERTKLSFRMLNQPLTLWRGLSPSLVRNVCGSSMYFCLLETAKTVNFLADMDENHLFLKNLVIGSICRTVSSISLFPFTFMKTRMESSYYSYSSLTNGLYSVVKNEGIIRLYTGLLPTLIRDVPFSAIYLAIFFHLRITSPININSQPILEKFQCGLIAATTACFITQPAEIVKTYCQVRPTSDKSSIIMNILTNRGLKSFWCGIGFRLMHKIFSTAITWTIYESISV